MSNVYKIEGDLPIKGIVFATREDAEAFLNLRILGVRQTYSDGTFGLATVPLRGLRIAEAEIPAPTARSAPD